MLLLITIDGLDRQALEAAVRQGKAPSLAQIARLGFQAPLTSPVPAESCAVWASIATGMLPERHGVFYAEEEWAGGLRPTSRASWRLPPIWERLAGEGLATASLCFPCSRPGAAWSGTHVDDRYLDVSGLGWDDWPLPLDAAPALLREILREVRVHGGDVAPAMLSPFLDGGSSPQTRTAAAIAIARSSTCFAAARILSERTRPDFLAVHLDWPRTFAAALSIAPDAPPPAPLWSLLDTSIGMLVRSAGAGATILILSPGKAGRRGFLVAAGAGIPAGAGAPTDLLDVAPTILAYFGLADPALPGKCLLPAPGALRALPPPASPREEEEADIRDLDRVSAFGHAIPQPPPWWPAPKLIAEAELLMERDPAAAAERVAGALAIAPQSLHALGLAGLLAFARQDTETLDDIAARLDAVAPGHLWERMVRAGTHVLRKDRAKASPLLRGIEAEGSPDDLLRVAGAWLMLGSRADAARVFERVLEAQPERVPALLGLASTKDGKPLDAEQILRRVLAIDPPHAAARAALAETLRFMGRSHEADRLAAGPQAS